MCVCVRMCMRRCDHVHAVAPMSHHVDIGDVGVKCQNPSLMWCKGEGYGQVREQGEGEGYGQVR